MKPNNLSRIYSSASRIRWTGLNCMLSYTLSGGNKQTMKKYVITSMNRLECPDCLENLINRKFRQFCIEAIPQKNLNSEKNFWLWKKSEEKKYENVCSFFEKWKKSTILNGKSYKARTFWWTDLRVEEFDRAHRTERIWCAQSLSEGPRSSTKD